MYNLANTHFKKKMEKHNTVIFSKKHTVEVHLENKNTVKACCSKIAVKAQYTTVKFIEYSNFLKYKSTKILKNKKCSRQFRENKY